MRNSASTLLLESSYFSYIADSGCSYKACSQNILYIYTHICFCFESFVILFPVDSIVKVSLHYKPWRDASMISTRLLLVLFQ